MKWSLVGIIVAVSILLLMGWTQGPEHMLGAMANSFLIVVFAVLLYFGFLLWKWWRGY